ALADRDRLVDPPAARRKVELGRVPLLFEPRRADPELEPAVRQEIDRLRAPSRGERMSQPDVEHVRTEPHAFRATGEETEIRERVEDRRVGGNGRMGLA